MRRRRLLQPGTQLARAGERTKLLIGDGHVPKVRFRATTLAGQPQGEVSVETVDGTRIADLGQENLLDTEGLISLSVVPEADTAITFVPVERPSNPLFFVVGSIVTAAAIGWTAWSVLAT